MSINSMPILVWGTLTASVGNLLAVPAVSLACVLLFMDRQFGTHFFDVEQHGQPLLWQHLFWMFGHPWVYAIVLPALSIVSDALPTFCRRPPGRRYARGARDRRHHDRRFRDMAASHVRDRDADAIAGASSEPLSRVEQAHRRPPATRGRLRRRRLPPARRPAPAADPRIDRGSRSRRRTSRPL